MKTRLLQNRSGGTGFTLIELLVVISIIAILAGLLVPVLIKPRTTAKVAQAKVEINSLVSAISKYEADNSRYPASTKLRSVIANGVGDVDFTFGTWYTDAEGTVSLMDKNQLLYTKIPVREVDNGYLYKNCNAEVMAALLDFETFKNGKNTPNVGHAMNPNKIGYLTVKEVSDAKSPGVGQDGVFRDPWGNPYIITVDLNGDGKCRDAFYKQATVSQIPGGGDKGFSGLYRSSGQADSFEANKPIMVWSFGADGLISGQEKANAGVNKDNILSW